MLNTLGIKNIRVEKLFGHYTYDLPKDNDVKDLDKLFILYGDNGVGKTTILNLIFYLLSTKEGSGYKSKIAQTKFKKFSITFSNNIEIGAIREKNIVGNYLYYLKKEDGTITSVQLNAKSEPYHHILIQEDDESIQKAYFKLLKEISSLKITLDFLSEDRKALNSLTSTDNDRASEYDSFTKNQFIRAKNYAAKLPLEETAIEFIEWIRKQVIQGSKTGETNTLHLYSEIIKNVGKPEEKTSAINVLIKQVNILEVQSQKLSELGLIDRLDFADLKKSISNIDDKNKKSLKSILQLFITSTSARLNALQGLYEILNEFIGSINQFYTNKNLIFNLSEGFKIFHDSGEELELDMLSSGEKQLFLLFINTITASDQATIFIIDEPEISLNIKWQRMLLKTLLKFSERNNVQFIIATHSIELLAPNKANVVKLEE